MFGNFPHSMYLFRTNGNWRYPGGVRALPGKASRQPPGPEPVGRDAAEDDQRRRILEAVAEQVAEQGYQETTIETIVRRAKVGYKTFYKHYPDKEAAFLALVDAGIEHGARKVEGAYRREEGPWPDRIGAALGALFDEVAANPTVARVCLVEANAAGTVAAERHEAALKRLAALIAPGRELNPRGDTLPESLEETIAGGIAWLLGQRLVAGEAAQLRGLLPETVEFVLRPFVGEDEAVREAGEVADAISA
jgi:AcrR family transcriptional regulator